MNNTANIQFNALYSKFYDKIFIKNHTPFNKYAINKKILQNYSEGF